MIKTLYGFECITFLSVGTKEVYITEIHFECSADSLVLATFISLVWFVGNMLGFGLWVFSLHS